MWTELLERGADPTMKDIDGKTLLKRLPPRYKAEKAFIKKAIQKL